MGKRMRMVVLGWVGLMAACPTTAGKDGDRCKQNSECEDALICASGKCGTVYARQWRLSPLSARISPTDSNGDTWDGDGSPPDPFIVVLVDGTAVLTTQTVQNSLTPTWTESAVININNNTRVVIQMWDEDFLIPQGMVATPDEAISAVELKQGQVTAFAITGPPDAGLAGSQTSVTYKWELVQ